MDEKKPRTFKVYAFNKITKRVETEATIKTKPIDDYSLRRLALKEVEKFEKDLDIKACWDYEGKLDV